MAPVAARQPLTLIITLTVQPAWIPSEGPTAGVPIVPAQSAASSLSNRGVLPSWGANHRFRLARTQGTWNARQRKERRGERPKNSSRLPNSPYSFFPQSRRWAIIANTNTPSLRLSRASLSRVTLSACQGPALPQAPVPVGVPLHYPWHFPVSPPPLAFLYTAQPSRAIDSFSSSHRLCISGYDQPRSQRRPRRTEDCGRVQAFPSRDRAL